MTARIDAVVRCLSCGHDPDLNNPTCGCTHCHLTGLPPSLRPHRVRRDETVHVVAPAPTHHLPSTSVRGRSHTYPASSSGWWFAAVVALVVTGFGAVAGWHESPWDTLAGIGLAVAFVIAGALWPEKGGR